MFLHFVLTMPGRGTRDPMTPFATAGPQSGTRSPNTALANLSPHQPHAPEQSRFFVAAIPLRQGDVSLINIHGQSFSNLQLRGRSGSGQRLIASRIPRHTTTRTSLSSSVIASSSVLCSLALFPLSIHPLTFVARMQAASTIPYSLTSRPSSVLCTAPDIVQTSNTLSRY